MPIGAEYRPTLTTTGIDTRVELDGWAAGAPNTTDSWGTQWGLGTDAEPHGIAGWWESPGVRLSHQPRPQRHGFYDGPAELSERVITISGAARSVDFASGQRSRDILLSVLGDPLLGLSTLTVYEAGRPTKQAAVRRSAEAKTRWLSDTFFEWSIILVAVDPRRYATTETSVFTSLPLPGTGGLVFPLVFPLTFGSGAAGGSVTLTNNGTISTPIRWTVLGPVTGPVITNAATGAKLEFLSTFALAAGQSMLIDTDARTVLQGSVNQRSQLAVAQWWDLDPGSLLVRFSGASADPATAKLTGTWRDAWT
jgi:tail protein